MGIDSICNKLFKTVGLYIYLSFLRSASLFQQDVFLLFLIYRFFEDYRNKCYTLF